MAFGQGDESLDDFLRQILKDQQLNKTLAEAEELIFRNHLLVFSGKKALPVGSVIAKLYDTRVNVISRLKTDLQILRGLSLNLNSGGQLSSLLESISKSGLKASHREEFENILRNLTINENLASKDTQFIFQQQRDLVNQAKTLLKKIPSNGIFSTDQLAKLKSIQRSLDEQLNVNFR